MSQRKARFRMWKIERYIFTTVQWLVLLGVIVISAFIALWLK